MTYTAFKVLFSFDCNIYQTLSRQTVGIVCHLRLRITTPTNYLVNSVATTTHLKAAVLNSSPRAPPLYIFFMSLLVNTPDSDNQLVRSALHEWTVFRLTCSLHSVHCSLLPEQGKAAEVYFTSEHSFMDLRCATSLRTDECDIIYVCKYIQFKFTSRTLQCTMNGIRSLRTGIMEEYRVMSTSQGTCVRIEQTSEVIRVTYEMCRAVGREDWNWEPLP